MKASVERWLHRRWYDGVEPGLGLRALAGIYRVISLGTGSPTQRLPVPVIVVGNFTAGGTGKTPLVIALAQYFETRGYRPGIISRGHGRTSRQPLQVVSGMSARTCGDEPKLMFQRTGLPVLVDADRVRAGRAAVAQGCTLLIADDGLQHRRLVRDIEIEVVDSVRGYGNGLLIPAGPLRETPRRCDFKVVNGGRDDSGGWSMRLQMLDAVAIRDTQSDTRGAAVEFPTRPLRSFAPGPVHAVAGIGNPGRFFAALRGCGLDLVTHAFEDHHRFVAGDFSHMDGPVLMTEKDAVKCRSLGLLDAWAVPVEAMLAPGFFNAVESALGAHHVRD